MTSSAQQMKILLIDNHDSFTYNLFHYFQREGVNVDVFRNDEISLKKTSQYSHFVISPGPGLPEESSFIMDLIDKVYGKKPLLGVCLGHQALAVYAGMSLYNLDMPMHGLCRDITVHPDCIMMKNLPSSMPVGLYHSWAVREENRKDWLFSAHTSDSRIVMGIENSNKMAMGVQFHPESIMTKYGREVVRNWLEISDR